MDTTFFLFYCKNFGRPQSWLHFTLKIQTLNLVHYIVVREWFWTQSLFHCCSPEQVVMSTVLANGCLLTHLQKQKQSCMSIPIRVPLPTTCWSQSNAIIPRLYVFIDKCVMENIWLLLVVQMLTLFRHNIRLSATHFLYSAVYNYSGKIIRAVSHYVKSCHTG